MELIETSEFEKMFCTNTPLLDVRAAIEFNQGAFPHATNQPLLNDDERQQVGTCYKQQGQDAAIKLGHKLVSGETKAQRIDQWKSYCQANPNAYLYCFRGGMRSNLVQQWLHQVNVEISLIAGGYKALRNYLLQVLEQPYQLQLISGQTGVGKTEFLHKIDNIIDLEGLANHCGSAFGKQINAQPSQINFENQMAIQLLKNKQNTNQAMIVEDESRYIGNLNIPKTFIQCMKSAPILLLNCSQEQRVNRIFKQYVVDQQTQYCSQFGTDGEQLFAQSLQGALEKIQKRLGGLRYKQLSEIMKKALDQQSEQLHKKWISELLENYYDPMYDYQLAAKKEKIIFTGNQQEIQQYLNNEAEYRT